MNGGAVHGGASPDGHVWINCHILGVGVTARISPDDAEALADQLRAWAEQARRSR